MLREWHRRFLVRKQFCLQVCSLWFLSFVAISLFMRLVDTTTRGNIAAFRGLSAFPLHFSIGTRILSPVLTFVISPFPFQYTTRPPLKNVIVTGFVSGS